MTRLTIYLFPIVLLLSSCFLNNKKDNKNEDPSEVASPKSEEQIAAEQKAKEDSIKSAEFELLQKNAFGDLMFGMSKDETEQNNDRNQKLGKYNYNFDYTYNGEKQLYKVKLSSSSQKAINYDSGLKSRYLNLRKIITIKYGEADSEQQYPSIFEVQEKRVLWIDRWDVGRKQIRLGLKTNSLNSYSVVSQISDKNMEESEKERLYKIKNKDVIQAADKF